MKLIPTVSPDNVYFYVFFMWSWNLNFIELHNACLTMTMWFWKLSLRPHKIFIRAKLWILEEEGTSLPSLFIHTSMLFKFVCLYFLDFPQPCIFLDFPITACALLTVSIWAASCNCSRELFLICLLSRINTIKTKAHTHSCGKSLITVHHLY